MTQPPFSIVGAGAWGSALAVQLCKNVPVVLYTRNVVKKHTLLKGARNKLVFTNQLKDAAQAEFIVLAVPSGAARQVLDELKPVRPDAKLIIATKGLMDDGEFISDAAEKLLKIEVSAIAGPNLASEVARNMPSAAVIGSKKEIIASEIAQRMSTDTFKVRPTTDLYALQISGCIKNVAAIISGALDGLEYGENAKAWIFSMALKDISVLSQASEVTSVGIAGDLALCCYSKHSRNYAFGMQLAKAVCREEFISSYQVLVEGKRNALTVQKLSQKHNVQSVLSSTLCAILANPQSLEKEIAGLFSA